MSDRENDNGSGESSEEENLQGNQNLDGDSNKQKPLKCMICDKHYKTLRSWKHGNSIYRNAT